MSKTEQLRDCKINQENKISIERSTNEFSIKTTFSVRHENLWKYIISRFITNFHLQSSLKWDGWFVHGKYIKSLVEVENPLVLCKWFHFFPHPLRQGYQSFIWTAAGDFCYAIWFAVINTCRRYRTWYKMYVTIFFCSI